MARMCGPNMGVNDNKSTGMLIGMALASLARKDIEKNGPAAYQNTYEFKAIINEIKELGYVVMPSTLRLTLSSHAAKWDAAANEYVDSCNFKRYTHGAYASTIALALITDYAPKLNKGTKKKVLDRYSLMKLRAAVDELLASAR